MRLTFLISRLESENQCLPKRDNSLLSSGNLCYLYAKLEFIIQSYIPLDSLLFLNLKVFWAYKKFWKILDLEKFSKFFGLGKISKLRFEKVSKFLDLSEILKNFGF